MYAAANRRAYGVALEGRFGQAYNEQAFRYFLEIERKRAARGKRPVLLLLLNLKKPRHDTRIDPALAMKVFSCLWSTLRETDVVGWYREERMIGAVLTGADGACGQEVTKVIRQRIGEALSAVLLPDAAHLLRVRVYRCRPQLKG
jgi:hypothetical protein